MEGLSRTVEVILVIVHQLVYLDNSHADWVDFNSFDNITRANITFFEDSKVKTEPPAF